MSIDSFDMHADDDNPDLSQIVQRNIHLNRSNCAIYNQNSMYYSALENNITQSKLSGRCWFDDIISLLGQKMNSQARDMVNNGTANNIDIEDNDGSALQFVLQSIKQKF